MKTYLIFFLLFLIVSCQEKTKDCDSCDEELIAETAVSNEELVMYEPSELATLMLEMYDANKNWKEEILKGNIPKDFPEKYKKMHSAQSTNENAGSDFYNNMTDSYLKTVEELTKATPETVKEKYNNMVKVCVSCHMQVCPGPISKIKKLEIK